MSFHGDQIEMLFQSDTKREIWYSDSGSICWWLCKSSGHYAAKPGFQMVKMRISAFLRNPKLHPGDKKCSQKQKDGSPSRMLHEKWKSSFHQNIRDPLSWWKLFNRAIYLGNAPLWAALWSPYRTHASRSGRVVAKI